MRKITPNIFIASDHAGYTLKQYLIKDLNASYTLIDLGTNSIESVDYPDYAHKLGKQLENDNDNMGVLICGSGVGVSIAVNKHKSCRAALCWTKEIARLSRQHNNANILCLPARFISHKEAKHIVKTFLESSFEGGRHTKRINKIEL